MLLLVGLGPAKAFSLLQIGQRRVLGVLLVVFALLIDGGKAGKAQALMVGAEDVTGGKLVSLVREDKKAE